MTLWKPPDTEIVFNSNVAFWGLCKPGFLAGIRYMLLYFHNEESTEPNKNIVQYWQKTFRAGAHKIMQLIAHKAHKTAVFGPLLLWMQSLALLFKTYSEKSCNGPHSAPVQSLHPERGPWKILPSFWREMCPRGSGSGIKSEITWFSHFCWSEPESSPLYFHLPGGSTAGFEAESCLAQAGQRYKHFHPGWWKLFEWVSFSAVCHWKTLRF